MVPDGDKQGEPYTQFRAGQWACRDSTAWLGGLGPLWVPGPHSVKAELEDSESFPALNVSNPNYDPKHLYNEQDCIGTCLWTVKY